MAPVRSSLASGRKRIQDCNPFKRCDGHIVRGQVGRLCLLRPARRIGGLARATQRHLGLARELVRARHDELADELAVDASTSRAATPAA